MNVFITRSPCVSKDDGRTILVLQQQPINMSDENWRFLESLPFGIVLFPNTTFELPKRIANGDLDGDKYFVCWEKKILNAVRCVPLNKKNEVAKDKMYRDKVPEGTSWLECGQNLQADVKTRREMSKLTGMLHSEWKKEPSSEEGQAFAEAYKASLDVSCNHALLRSLDTFGP